MARRAVRAATDEHGVAPRVRIQVAPLVQAVVALAHTLGMEVVAEGVETHAALALLTVMGCDMIQGYHLAKPMPGADLEEWLTKKPIASLDSVIR